MKKALITISIILGICVVGVGGYYYEAQASENHTTKTTSKIENQNTSVNTDNNTNSTEGNKTSTSNNNVESINNATTSNDNANSANNNNNNNVNSVATSSSNNQTKSNNNVNNVATSSDNTNSVNTPNTSNDNVNNTNNNPATNNNSTNTSNDIKSENSTAGVSQSNSNKGSIKIIVPSQNIDNQFPMSTVIVENQTGKPISNSMLNNVIRSWILTWQFNSVQYCVATGENWAKPWLDAIPNSALINTFIKANGEESLSKNITANEINKGAMLYTKESYSKAYPFPFDQQQAEVYIQQMLNKDYPGNKIEKIVFHPNVKGQNTAGLYYVYTNVSIKEHFNQPFWYVYSNTGQATGV